MKAKSTTFSFRVKKQIIRDKKYFVYHHKEYEVNFDLLKNNTNYFYKNRSKYQEEKYIEIINEEEEYVKLSDESIQAFISSCQNEPCTIEKSSVIPLQYLAHKYEFAELIEITDKFIEEHSEDLVFDNLFFKIYKMNGKNCNSSFSDTSKEEKIISEHLTEFIQKEEMLKLPIPLLYRVLKLFSESQHNKDEIKSDMTDFLFKCLDKYGRPASVLFNLIDFKEQRIELVNRLIENYSNLFDFNQINQTLTKTVQDLTSEVKQMQETLSKQLEELKEMKKLEEEKQIKNEIENQKRIKNFSSDVDKIKNNVDEKMKSIQDQFQQICMKQEEFIDNAVVKKYHQMILETITFGQFHKFDDKLKDHFKTELVKIEQNNNKELLHTNVILDCISIPESCENIQIIQIFKGDVKSHSKIKITNNIIEDLNQKEQLDSCLINCVNISNDILVEIEYPCNKFEQKMKIISDIKTQKCQNMKVSVTINDKSYFEQKEFINDVDVIIFQENLLKSITVSQFHKFDDKSKSSFLKGLYKNNEIELLRAKLLLDLSSIPDSYDYYPLVDFLREYENNQTKFTLTKDKVENLYQKSQLVSCLTNCVMAFNDFIVEIEYISNKFEQIMKIISDIKIQKGQNIEVLVILTDKSRFDQKWLLFFCKHCVYEIHAIDAKDLIAKDVRTPDPYLKFFLKKLGSSSSIQTNVIKSNISPVWNQHLTLEADDIADTLVVEMYDQGSNDILMDPLEFPLTNISPQAPVDFDSVIQYKGKPAGHLRLQITSKDHPAISYLDIHLVRARNLSKDVGGSEPFAFFYLKSEGREKGVKSKFIENDLSPVWDQHLALTALEQDDSLIVEIWDDDISLDEPYMDTLECPINTITRERPLNFDQDIKRKGKPAGHLEFHVRCIQIFLKKND